jgi:Fibronectin type III domain
MRRIGLLLLLLGLARPVHAAGIKLTWDPPGGPVDTYRVLYGVAPGTYTQTVDTGGPVTTATITNLTPGQQYFFAVVAVLGTAVSPPSNEVTTTIPAGVDPACLPPLGNRAIAIFPTALQKTGSGGAGTKARLDFQLASQSPIISVRVVSNGTALATMNGTDLTSLAGMWFVVPTALGAYPLSITASNLFGCTQQQSTTYTVRVP